MRRGCLSARSSSWFSARASSSRSATGEKNVIAATIGSGVSRPTTCSSLGDRREKRDRGDDRLGRLTAHDLLDCHPRRELPQPAAGTAELRDDRFLRQRGEPAESLEPELAQPAVRVGIEREDGEWLGGEKRRLLPGRTITASPGRARVAATQETNLPFPHPTRNAERGSGNAEQASDLPASVPRSALRVPRLITSTIPSGAPDSPSNPSVPTRSEEPRR